MTEEQGLLDVFEPPYRSRFHEVIAWCGPCQRECVGYDALHNMHNICTCSHGATRGLGCQCFPMSATLGHVIYEIDRIFEPGVCHCSGKPGVVNGSGKKHKATPDHRIAQLVGYWVPRVFAAWPRERHEALRTHIEAYARYHGVLDLMTGDEVAA